MKAHLLRESDCCSGQNPVRLRSSCLFGGEEIQSKSLKDSKGGCLEEGDVCKGLASSEIVSLEERDPRRTGDEVTRALFLSEG